MCNSIQEPHFRGIKNSILVLNQAFFNHFDHEPQMIKDDGKTSAWKVPNSPLLHCILSKHYVALLKKNCFQIYLLQGYYFDYVYIFKKRYM